MQSKILIKQNEYQKLTQFKSFNSVEEMDKHIQQHCKSLSRGQKQFLRLLSRYCVMTSHIGVCWRKNKTLADELEVSSRTINRYVAEMVKCGILKVVNTFAISTQDNVKKPKQGANIYIILPCKEVKTEEMSSMGDNVTSLLKQKNLNLKIKSIRKEVVTEPKINELDHSFLPNHIPPEFVKATRPFFSASQIFKLWGKVLLAAKIARIDDVKSLLQAIIQQFKATIFLLKKNRVRDLNAYWYAGIYQVFVQHQRRLYASKQTYNWLTS